MRGKKLSVTVFGSGVAAEGDPLWRVAEQLGEALATAGFSIINGGYGGTMAAVSRGAKRAGGHVTGVLVSTFRRQSNPFLDETVVSDTLLGRLRELLHRGQAFIVLPGSTGTLTELALTWEMMMKGLIPQRPVILLGKFWESVADCASGGWGSDLLPTRSGKKKAWPHFLHCVETVQEAVELLRRSS